MVRRVDGGRFSTQMRQAAGAAAAVQNNECEVALKLLEFLGAWLHDHVRLADRMLAAYLRNQQRARSGQAS